MTTTLDLETGRIEKQSAWNGSSWGRPSPSSTASATWTAPSEGGFWLEYVQELLKLEQEAVIAANGDAYCRAPSSLPADAPVKPVLDFLSHGINTMTTLFASLEPRTFRLEAGCSQGPAEAPPIEITVSEGELHARTNGMEEDGFHYVLGEYDGKGIAKYANRSNEYRGSQASFPKGDENPAQYLRLVEELRSVIETVANGNACTPAESVMDLQEALALLDAWRGEVTASTTNGTLFSDRLRIFSTSTVAACDLDGRRAVWVSKSTVDIKYTDGWNLIYEFTIDRTSEEIHGYSVEHGPGSYAAFVARAPSKGGDRVIYERWLGEAKRTTETVRDGTPCNDPVPELEEVRQYLDTLGH